MKTIILIAVVGSYSDPTSCDMDKALMMFQLPDVEWECIDEFYGPTEIPRPVARPQF